MGIEQIDNSKITKDLVACDENINIDYYNIDNDIYGKIDEAIQNLSDNYPTIVTYIETWLSKRKNPKYNTGQFPPYLIIAMDEILGE